LAAGNTVEEIIKEFQISQRSRLLLAWIMLVNYKSSPLNQRNEGFADDASLFY